MVPSVPVQLQGTDPPPHYFFFSGRFRCALKLLSIPFTQKAILGLAPPSLKSFSTFNLELALVTALFPYALRSSLPPTLQLRLGYHTSSANESPLVPFPAAQYLSPRSHQAGSSPLSLPPPLSPLLCSFSEKPTFLACHSPRLPFSFDPPPLSRSPAGYEAFLLRRFDASFCVEVNAPDSAPFSISMEKSPYFPFSSL